MDMQYVLLNPNGRIAPREFGIGVLILIGGNTCPASCRRWAACSGCS